MRHFALYWRPSTVDDARTNDPRVRYAASNQFDRISRGDVVWLVTAPAGRLSLIGRILVDVVADRALAVDRLGIETLWEADHYVLPASDAEAEIIADLDLSEHVATVRFDSADGEAALVVNDGKINAQQLQTMRLLTAGTAECFERLWSNRARRLVLVTTAEGIRKNMREFNQHAGSNLERTRSLISTTEYWIFDGAGMAFGPAKFLGYEAMTFDLYEAAQRHEVTGARFDGHVTRTAAESVLGAFVDDPDLADHLDAWALSLMGRGIGDGVDRTKWRFARLESVAAVVGAPVRNVAMQQTADGARPVESRKEKPMDDEMYDCEVKILFVNNGQREWRWERRAVKTFGDDREVRCLHCHGRVRVHRQQVPHGPADHVEHLLRRDSDHCRGGHHFKGDHRLSDEPVM